MNTISDIHLPDISRGRKYTPSPQNWEELIIYFLLADRFSDGNEQGYIDAGGREVSSGNIPPYSAPEDFDMILKDKVLEETWYAFSEKRNGGTLQGIHSKLGYLKRLGISALWISPVFKQPEFEDSYHGYGIQNFLKIEPRLGTKEDLAELVRDAHEMGMYVILDIIVNHTGNVFTYESETVPWTGEEYQVRGFNTPEGKPDIPPNSQEGDAVGPKELQVLESFSRKGSITDWDNYPEYIEGDFYSLKNVFAGTGEGESFQPSEALKIITECYKYWIAYADIDGFRLDTVKHIQADAVRYFSEEIHEFAHTLGKNNFYIIGEITGGFDFAVETQKKTGLDAALGLSRIPESLEQAAKGYAGFGQYFDIFRNSPVADEEENRWYRNNVITMFDDHDMVTQSEHHKQRFCADRGSSPLLVNALCMNILTMGIPCIYYGTEQGFDGEGDHDKYIRECMFGGSFGAFRTSGRHFFNENHPVYREFSRLAALRQEYLPLQYGRQYIREISYDGKAFEVPDKTGDERFSGVYGWSRIYSSDELLILVNTSLYQDHEVSAVIDWKLHEDGEFFQELYRPGEEELSGKVMVKTVGERKVLRVRVPEHGCVILRKHHG